MPGPGLEGFSGTPVPITRLTSQSRPLCAWSHLTQVHRPLRRSHMDGVSLAGSWPSGSEMGFLSRLLMARIPHFLLHPPIKIGVMPHTDLPAWTAHCHCDPVSALCHVIIPPSSTFVHSPNAHSPLFRSSGQPLALHDIATFVARLLSRMACHVWQLARTSACLSVCLNNGVAVQSTPLAPPGERQCQRKCGPLCRAATLAAACRPPSIVTDIHP